MTERIYKITRLFVLVALLFSIISGFMASPVSAVKVKAEGVEKEITVFSWEDYIEEAEDDTETGVLEDFETETGIKVNYYTFATCEEMYNELKKDPTACDIVCPSEYMILKMKDEGLIKQFNMPENYIQNASPYIKSVFEDLGLSDGERTYAVGYMWGTMGLIYNMDKYKAEDLNSWSKLYDQKFSGKITIKDSIRDSYIMSLGIVYKDELLSLKDKLNAGEILEAEYKEKISEVFNRVDEKSIREVRDALIELKSNLYGFEVDAGKNDILTGKIDVNFAWSGDAAYAIYESNEGEGYSKLGYVVPEEGSNVWFDGWVLTKDADEELALEFMDFMSRPEIAVRNMDYIGYTSCIAGTEDTSVFDYILDCYGNDEGEYTVDLKYFFDPECTTDAYVVRTDEIGRQFSAQYPTEQEILRCAVMNNFSAQELELVNKMWNEVKLITLSDLALILILVLIVLVVLFLVAYKYFPQIFVIKKKNAKRFGQKKGWKVVKIENFDTN